MVESSSILECGVTEWRRKRERDKTIFDTDCGREFSQTDKRYQAINSKKSASPK